jgi:hypothetical protein
MEQGTNLTAKKGTFDTLLWFLFPEMYNNPGNRSVEIFFDRSIDPNARVENVSFQNWDATIGRSILAQSGQIGWSRPRKKQPKIRRRRKNYACE